MFFWAFRMMKKIALLAVALGVSAAAHADVQLQALPSYVQRLFVPVVPQTTNRVAIKGIRFDEVLNVPPGFDVRVVNGSIVAFADDSGRAGYARVRAGKRELSLTLMSVVPYTAVRNGSLDGYRVGQYVGNAPSGFIRLSNTNESLFVSDHYRLRDFQCKLDGTSKYLVLRPEALLKLEILQHELQGRGIAFDRFTVMSGFRTPYYNAKIGNETSRSRHLYGDAMDIYVDANRDGTMDDLNRDGRIDTADAQYLLSIAEDLDHSTEWGWLKGGAGVYHANAAHGPYLHVDARGHLARWGDLAPPAASSSVVTAARCSAAQNHRRAGETKRSAQHIGQPRHGPLDEREPDERADEVHAAIRRERPARKRRIDARERECKNEQADRARSEPPDAATESKPHPCCIAAGDLARRRESEPEHVLHERIILPACRSRCKSPCSIRPPA